MAARLASPGRFRLCDGLGQGSHCGEPALFVTTKPLDCQTYVG